MTDHDPDTDQTGDSEPAATTTRRGVLAALGIGGFFVGRALSGNSGGGTEATIGGGPMSSQVSHLSVEWLEGSFSDRPSAGVEGRFFYVSDPNDAEYGNVYADEGGSWSRIALGVDELITSLGTIEDSSQDPANNGEIRRNGSDVKVYTGGGVKDLGNIGSGGSGSPGGNDTEIQYNNQGAFGGISGFTFDGTNLTAVPGIDATLALVDQAADPSTNGEIQLNGSDVKAYSGGGVRNLSQDTITRTAGSGLKYSSGSAGTALGGSSTLAIEPADFAGTGLEDGGSDSLQIDYAADVVERPQRNPIVALDNGESVEIAIEVPDQDTLSVYRWGAFDASDGSVPTSLDVQLKDGSDTVQASANTGNKENKSSAVASYQNTTGSSSIFKLAANNGTGSAINSPGVGSHFGWRVE